MNMQSGFASALSLALAHSLWQLTLLGLLAALCLAVMRQSSAALRHVVGMGWLLAMVWAPATTFAGYWQTATLAPGREPLHAAAAPLFTLPGLAERVAPWAAGSFAWVTQLWLVGVVLMALLHIGGGWRMLRQLERAPYADLPPEWQRRVEAMRAALGITRTVAVRLAAGVGTPFTARMLRPVVWLPQTLLSQLPVEQIKVLLAHELAHIRRVDWLWNGIECVIESLLFFHPAMWWLSRRIRQDREHACDDLAVAVCGDGIALAEALSALARQGLTTPPLLLAAKGGPLMKRITHILSQPRARTTWRGPAFLVLLLSSGMLFAMQAQAPLQLPGNPNSCASSNGSLPPGNCEFIATSPAGKQLRYQYATDARGRLTETYTEDGKAKPIDRKVRAWIRQMETLALVPPPPAPPVPARPAAPAAPAAQLDRLPALPAPPAPPAVSAVPALPAPPAPPALPALAALAAPPAPPAPPALPALPVAPAPAIDDE
jgi:beta-lactamase regulating signal transducer with metallopeptidase domain